MDEIPQLIWAAGLVLAIFGALAAIGPVLELWTLLDQGATQSSQGEVPVDVIRSMVYVALGAAIPVSVASVIWFAS